MKKTLNFNSASNSNDYVIINNNYYEIKNKLSFFNVNNLRSSDLVNNSNSSRNVLNSQKENKDINNKIDKKAFHISSSVSNANFLSNYK